MRLKLFLSFLWLMLAVMLVNGQDLHFSYYQFTPLNINPANAGAFSGSYRLSGIYSDKQAAVTPRPFRTFALSVDAPIMRGIRKQDWIGIGVEMDLVGSSGLVFNNAIKTEDVVNSSSFQSWTFMRVGGAYHLSLDKKQTNILTLGAQFSNGNRNYIMLSQKDGRVNPETGQFDLDIDKFNNTSTAGGTSPGAVNKVKTGNKDWNIGLLFNSRQKKSDLRLGISLEGILKPKLGLLKQERKYRGLNIHGSYDMTVNSRVHIIPGFYYYNLGPANAFNVNSHISYKIDPEKDFLVSTGIGLRNFRSLMFFAGGEFNDIKVGLAFDLDISTLSAASNSIGGFELCASYMGKIYKKPKTKPVIICPRL